MENWHKSSYSANAQACVEVAEDAQGAAVRDTRHREAGSLAFDRREWAAFVRAARAGEL